jgi:hypothetical protein
MKAVPDTLQSGGAAFVTTRWSVVLTAQGRSPAAQDALEKLCRSYWMPLYAFVRRAGFSPEEAQDLTQEFFARFCNAETSTRSGARRDDCVPTSSLR